MFFCSSLELWGPTLGSSRTKQSSSLYKGFVDGEMPCQPPRPSSPQLTDLPDSLSPARGSNDLMRGAPAQQAEMLVLEYLTLQTTGKRALSKHTLVSHPPLRRWLSHNVTFSQEPLRNNHQTGAVCSFL